MNLNFIIDHLPEGTGIQLGTVYLREDSDVQLALEILRHSSAENCVDKAKTVQFFILHNNIEALELLGDYGILTRQSIGKYIDFAHEHDAIECQAWLMDYKAKNYPSSFSMNLKL